MPSGKKKRALPPPPGLDFVTLPKDSLVDDLRYALEHAKELYADIAWDFIIAPSPTIIYAHKAILYARSSRSFKERFLKTNKDANGSSIRSVRLSNPDSIVKTDADPFLVRQELKFFYTGEEGGEDFLAAVDTTDELEQVKLKEDLLYMLKLYTDIEIVLDYSDDNLEVIEENEEAFKPIRAHKFMLYIRSDYFKKMLSSDFIESRSPTIYLDANIFDHTSLNLILTYIYTGSISSSKTPLTLDTCELVWIGADYLGIKLLCDECIHRIATKAHCFTCTCPDCQVVVPRIANFAKVQDVEMLWKGCLHVLSYGFDNMWPQKAFADLDEETREEVLLTVLAHVQTNNIMAIFKGCRKILSNIDVKGIGLPWIETIRGMTHQVRSYTVQILVDNFEQLCNEDQEFLDCVDGVGFSSDLLEDIMNIVVEEGLSEDNSVRVLKCIAGKLLTRQAVMDSENFETKRVLVQTKQNVFDYIKKRWISVKEKGGFRLLSPWLLDEFSKELGVTNQELQDATDPKETKPKARTPSVTNGLSKKGREASPVSTSKTTKSTATTPLIITTSPQPDTSSSSTGNKNTVTTNGNSGHAHSPSDSSDKSSVGSADTATKTNGNGPKPKKGKSVRIGETTTAPVWARPTRASLLRQKALEESSAKNPVKPRTKTTTSINSSSSSKTSTDSTQTKSTLTSKTKTTTTTTRTLRQSSSSSSLRVPNGTSTSQRGRSSTRKTPPKQNTSASSSRASSISSITSVNSPSVSPSRFGGVRQTRSSMLRQLKYDDVEQRRGRDLERGSSPASSRASSISSVNSNTTTSSHHRRKRSPSQNSTSTSITSTSSGAITSLQPKPHQVKLATVPNPVISVDNRVILPTKNNAPGTIRFLGETEFAKGIWVGIELDNPVGKNNGKVASTKYFAAEQNHGIFVRPDSLLLI